MIEDKHPVKKKKNDSNTSTAATITTTTTTTTTITTTTTASSYSSLSSNTQNYQELIQKFTLEMAILVADPKLQHKDLTLVEVISIVLKNCIAMEEDEDKDLKEQVLSKCHQFFISIIQLYDSSDMANGFELNQVFSSVVNFYKQYPQYIESVAGNINTLLRWIINLSNLQEFYENNMNNFKKMINILIQRIINTIYALCAEKDKKQFYPSLIAYQKILSNFIDIYKFRVHNVTQVCIELIGVIEKEKEALDLHIQMYNKLSAPKNKKDKSDKTAIAWRNSLETCINDFHGFNSCDIDTKLSILYRVEDECKIDNSIDNLLLDLYLHLIYYFLTPIIEYPENARNIILGKIAGLKSLQIPSKDLKSFDAKITNLIDELVKKNVIQPPTLHENTNTLAMFNELVGASAIHIKNTEIYDDHTYDIRYQVRLVNEILKDVQELQIENNENIEFDGFLKIILEIHAALDHTKYSAINTSFLQKSILERLIKSINQQINFVCVCLFDFGVNIFINYLKLIFEVIKTEKIQENYESLNTEASNKIKSFNAVIVDLKIIMGFYERVNHEIKIIELLQSAVRCAHIIWNNNIEFGIILHLKILQTISEEKYQSDPKYKGFMQRYCVEINKTILEIYNIKKVNDSDTIDYVLSLVSHIVFTNPRAFETLTVYDKQFLIATLNKYAKDDEMNVLVFKVVQFFQFYINILNDFNNLKSLDDNNKNNLINQIVASLSIHIKNNDIIAQYLCYPDIKGNLLYLMTELLKSKGFPMIDFYLLEFFDIESMKKIFQDIELSNDKMMENIFNRVANFYLKNPHLILCTTGKLDDVLDWVFQLYQSNYINPKNPIVVKFIQMLLKQLSSTMFYILDYNKINDFYKNITDYHSTLKKLSQKYHLQSAASKTLFGTGFINDLKDQTVFIDSLVMSCQSIVKPTNGNTTQYDLEEGWLIALDASLRVPNLKYYEHCAPTIKFNLVNKINHICVNHSTKFLFLELYTNLVYYYYVPIIEHRVTLRSEILLKFEHFKKLIIHPSQMVNIDKRIIDFIQALLDKNIIKAFRKIDSEEPIKLLERIFNENINPQVVSQGSKTNIKPNTDEFSAIRKDAELKNKITNNKKVINSSYASIVANAARYKIKLSNNYSGLNDLINQLSNILGELKKQQANKRNDGHIQKLIEGIVSLIITCKETLLLENIEVIPVADTILKKYSSQKDNKVGKEKEEEEEEVEEDSEYTQNLTLLKSSLQNMINTLNDVSVKRNSNPFIFLDILNEYLDKCEKLSNECIEDSEVKKILKKLRGKVIALLNEKYEIKHCFSKFYTHQGDEKSDISNTLEKLNLLNEKKDLVKKILGTEAAGLINTARTILVNLQKLEQMMSLNRAGDIPIITELARSICSIKFSDYEYNPDILGFFIQKVYFVMNASKNHLSDENKKSLSTVYNNLKKSYHDYCKSNVVLKENQGQRGILLIQYIVLYDLNFYFTCSDEIKLYITKLSEELKLKNNSKSHHHFNFIIYTLEFILLFDDCSQEKKHALANEVLKKFNDVKSEGNHKYKYSFLCNDNTMIYLERHLSKKLGVSYSPDTDAGNFKELLESIRPFNKVSSNPSLGEVKSAHFTNITAEVKTEISTNNVINMSNTV